MSDSEMPDFTKIRTHPNIVPVEYCECQDFLDAQESGTDNEGYGRLFHWNGFWSVGCRLSTPTFCPWCGKRLKAKE